MKKFLVLLLCAAVLSAALCGCVEKPDDSDADASNQSDSLEPPAQEEPSLTLPSDQEKTPAGEPMTKPTEDTLPTTETESSQPMETPPAEDNRPTVGIPEPVTPPDVNE